MQLSLSKEHMLGRILTVHHLANRRPVSDILTTVDTIGVHTPSQDSLGMVLVPRIDGFDNGMVGPLFERGQLIRTLGVRKAIRVMSPAEWKIMAHALTPLDEAELLSMIIGAKPLLLRLRVSAMHVLKMVCEVLPTVLAGERMGKTRLGQAVALSVQEFLNKSEREIWRWPSFQYQGQTLGESLVRHLLPVAALSVPLRLVDDPKSNGFLYTIGREDDMWRSDDGECLVRRFLHAYGPADREAFASWAQISFSHASRLWHRVPEAELVEISGRDKLDWMLASDVSRMGDMVLPEGVRFISPYDPFLRMPHRSLLINGKRQHTYFFRSAGAPGMVLADGRCVAGWYLKKTKSRCTFHIEDIGEALGTVAVDELEEEANRMAKAFYRTCEGVSVVKMS